MYSNETTNLPISRFDFCENELRRSLNMLNNWGASEVLKGHLDVGANRPLWEVSV